MSTFTFAIVSKADNPIYELVVSPKKDEPTVNQQNQFFLHAVFSHCMWAVQPYVCASLSTSVYFEFECVIWSLISELGARILRVRHFGSALSLSPSFSQDIFHVEASINIKLA